MAAAISTDSFGRIKTMDPDKTNVTHYVVFRMISIEQHGKIIDLRTENVKYRTVKSL